MITRLSPEEIATLRIALLGRAEAQDHVARRQPLAGADPVLVEHARAGAAQQADRARALYVKIVEASAVVVQPRADDAPPRRIVEGLVDALGAAAASYDAAPYPVDPYARGGALVEMVRTAASSVLAAVATAAPSPRELNHAAVQLAGVAIRVLADLVRSGCDTCVAGRCAQHPRDDAGGDMELDEDAWLAGRPIGAAAADIMRCAALAVAWLKTEDR